MSKIFRTHIGDVTLTAVQDTWTRVPAANMVRPELQADMTRYAHLLDDEGMTELSMTGFVLESEGTRILVDSCLADQAMPRSGLEQPAELPQAMAEAELPPESIDYVVHTHLHFDHVGWNTYERDGAVVPTFPAAKHIVQRVEWDFWHANPEQAFGPDFERHFAPLEAAGQLAFIEDDDHALTSEVSIIYARGHTPGHQAVRIASDGAAGYIIGDACHVPPQACEPTWSSGADVDPEAAAATRAKLFQRIEDEQAFFISGHFPFPGIGHRVARDGGKDYVPIDVT